MGQLESIRLNKYLAECGICSRRDADRMIDEGRVRVNGALATPGMKVTREDEIFVGKKKISGPEKKRVYAFYKPVGVTCTEKDPYADRIITDVVKLPVRVTYAGRLDRDSEGLLLLTNDGDLIERMMRGANGHEKEYVVKVNKEITDVFVEKMQKGIYLKELDVTTRPCQVTKEGKYTFRIVLTQGLNRQIRRMSAACGYKVTSLKRIRVVNVELGKLKSGEYRELTDEELQKLYLSV